ncbi:glycoside hydrolase superfamily [Infundibulicybe gibba]|nr:glycoside hydrolase superfamily [Infundibulicybe gibba]
MSPPSPITISKHTTASAPRPHILYSIRVDANGKSKVVDRRYSEFVSLHETLNDKFTLPPRRLLSTTFLPSAWVDDALISERKAGLANYLSNLLATPEYKNHASLMKFLSEEDAKAPPSGKRFDLEDALPSTLSRRAAMNLRAQAESLDTTATSLIAAAYYPDWSAGSFPPESLNYSKFDILLFAFVVPNSSSGISWDSGSQSILQRLVSSARNSGAGTKIVLSVGGWGGCQWYSSAVSTAANRTTFTNALSNAVNTYGLDGMSEYPNSEGAGNPHSPSDSANLLSLLQSLRSALGSSKIISAAVPHLPWLGSNGNPLTDVSAYAAQMTYVNIMCVIIAHASTPTLTQSRNYDVWGNLCGTSTQPQASAQAALAQWTRADLLGLPLYGYVSQSSKTGLTGSLLPSSEMLLLQRSKPEDAVQGEPGMHFLNGAHARPKELKTAAANANLQSWYGQQIPFSSIVSSGALVKKSDGTYGEGGGFTMGWDDCSDTPFLFNVSQKTVVTYDGPLIFSTDTYSLGDKATFARQNGMAGCFTWSLDQDDGLSLQNVIRSSLGK